MPMTDAQYDEVIAAVDRAGTKPPKYGQAIEWDGNRISVNGFDSREEAERTVVQMAVNSGWTPRRWWQF